MVLRRSAKLQGFPASAFASSVACSSARAGLNFITASSARMATLAGADTASARQAWAFSKRPTGAAPHEHSGSMAGCFNTPPYLRIQICKTQSHDTTDVLRGFCSRNARGFSLGGELGIAARAAWATRKEDAMQCPDCKRYRHDGPCEPVYDEPEDLEMLQIDAEQAAKRYLDALKRAEHEPR